VNLTQLNSNIAPNNGVEPALLQHPPHKTHKIIIKQPLERRIKYPGIRRVGRPIDSVQAAERRRYGGGLGRICICKLQWCFGNWLGSLRKHRRNM
jgi:hypothetical protein